MRNGQEDKKGRWKPVMRGGRGKIMRKGWENNGNDDDDVGERERES